MEPTFKPNTFDLLGHPPMAVAVEFNRPFTDDETEAVIGLIGYAWTEAPLAARQGNLDGLNFVWADHVLFIALYVWNGNTQKRLGNFADLLNTYLAQGHSRLRTRGEKAGTALVTVPDSTRDARVRGITPSFNPKVRRS